MASRRAATSTSPGRKPPRSKPAPVVLDSSCWLEHFADTKRAPLFAAPIGNVASLIVPIVTIYEVVKKLSREVGDEVASDALTLMKQGRVILLDLNLTLAATRLRLPLADSLIYATAQAYAADLWTQDGHFDGLPGVRCFPRPVADTE